MRRTSSVLESRRQSIQQDSSNHRCSISIGGAIEGATVDNLDQSMSVSGQTRQNRSRSIFSSSVLFDTLEDERVKATTAAALKPKNPRIPEVEADRRVSLPVQAKLRPVMAGGAVTIESPTSASPRFSSRSPSPTPKHKDGNQSDHGGDLRDAHRCDGVFIPCALQSGAFVSIPSVSFVVRALNQYEHDWGRVKWNDTATVVKWIRFASSFVYQTGWVSSRRDGERTGGTTKDETSGSSSIAAASRGGDGRVFCIDLRWVPFLHGTTLEEREQECDLAEMYPSSGAGDVARSVLLNESGVSCATWLNTGEVMLSAVVKAPSNNPQQHPRPNASNTTTTSVATSGDGSPIQYHTLEAQDLMYWAASLLQPNPASSIYCVPQALAEAVERIVLDGPRGSGDDEKVEEENACTTDAPIVVVLLPGHPNASFRPTTPSQQGHHHRTSSVVSSEQLNSSTTMTTKHQHLVPKGLEGYTCLSDDASQMYLIGGMVSYEVAAALGSGVNRCCDMALESRAPFSFSRSLRSFKIHGMQSPQPLCVTSNKSRACVGGAKVFKVPGVAYGTAVLCTPPTAGFRDGDQQRVLIFGGFLDCVPKASSLHNTAKKEDAKTKSPVSLTRYGWQDCTVVAAPYNTTADSPVMIPAAFNGDLIREASNGKGRGYVASWKEAREQECLPTLYCTNAVWSLDLSTQQWNHVISAGCIPEPRAHHSAAVCGTWMLSVGGISEGCRLCTDVVALHMTQHIWVRVVTDSVPLGLHPLIVTTPELLLLGSRPQPADDNHQAAVKPMSFLQMNMKRLIKAAESRRRIEIGALKHEVELSESSTAANTSSGSAHGGKKKNALMQPLDAVSKATTMLRTEEELNAIVHRLTVADESSMSALAALRAKHEAESNAICGASSYLRTIERPFSQLSETSERLYENGRSQRRFEAAMKFVHDHYDAKMKKPKVLTEEEVLSSVKRMSEMTHDMWEKNRADRLKKWERKQEEQRLPPSAVELQKHDASYVPPALSASEITDRLTGHDPLQAREALYEVFVEKLRHQHEEESKRQRRRAVSPTLSKEEIQAQAEKLMHNAVAMEHKCKLFERYVVEPESRRK